jgi:hypothetical protein
MRKLILILLAVCVIKLCFPARPARADVAPVPNPPGGNINPGDETKVQMVAERVIIDFRASTDDTARVTADFIMHNLGDKDEQMKVRFPLNAPNPGLFEYVLIKDFNAWVNGEYVVSRVITDTNAGYTYVGQFTLDLLYWAVFDVNFPSGKDVKIRVTYTLEPTDIGGGREEAFYILSTGAGWYGPIGTAEVIFRFPYMVNNLNIGEYYYQDQSYIRLVENEVRYHRDNFEPIGLNEGTLSNVDNVSIILVNPTLWLAVVKARSAIITLPDDAKAWLALARAYHAAGDEKHGCFENDEFRNLIIQAYEIALNLDPQNASVHAEFASVLLFSECWNQDKDRIYQEISIALHFDPENELALDLIDNIKAYRDINFILPTYGPTSTSLPPTATTTSTSTITPTRKFYPTSVLPPTYTRGPSPTSQPKASRTPKVTPTIPITPTEMSTATASPSPSSTASSTVTPPAYSPSIPPSPQLAAAKPIASGPIAVIGLILIVGLFFIVWLAGRGRINKPGIG